MKTSTTITNCILSVFFFFFLNHIQTLTLARSMILHCRYSRHSEKKGFRGLSFLTVESLEARLWRCCRDKATGVIADSFRRADVPGGTHPLADMFRQNISASGCIPAGTSTWPRKRSGPRKRSARAHAWSIAAIELV